MTVAEELYSMGVPQEKCESLARTLILSAASTGYPLSGILQSARILIQKESSIPREPLSPFSAYPGEKRILLRH